MIDPNELILISVDDHICEPRDMFDAHVPDKYRDQAVEVQRKQRAAGAGE